MHLIAGALLSLLLSGKKNDSHLSIMEKDMVVSHNLPGRIRIYSHKMKNTSVGLAMEKELIKVDGIDQVISNAVTGSLLIIYNHQQIKSDLLSAAVYQLLGFNSDKQKQQESSLYKELYAANQAINHALMEKSNRALDMKTIIAGTFFVLGVRELMKNKSLGMPASITLFYWAYNTLGLNR